MTRNITKILDVNIDSLTVKEAEDQFSQLTENKRSSIVTTPNTEMIIRAQNMRPFLELLNKKSRLNLPDSFGIIWAAKFLSLKVPQNKLLKFLIVVPFWALSIIFLPFFSKYYRGPIKDKVSGSDFIWNISRIAAQKKLRLFLFGGEPTVAEQAALKLQTEINDLRVTGTLEGDISIGDEKIIEAIKKSKADILLIALGSPLQEFWLEKNLSKTGCKVGIGIGGTFDFISNRIKRAPLWMQKRGLEWFFRLILEPKRIKRQIAIPKLMWRVLLEKLGE